MNYFPRTRSSGISPVGPQISTSNLLILSQVEGSVSNTYRTGVSSVSFVEVGGGALTAATAKFGDDSYDNPGTAIQSTDYQRWDEDGTETLYFEFTGEFTIEMWLRINAFNDNFHPIFSLDTAFNALGNMYLEYAVASNTMSLRRGTGGSGTGMTGASPANPFTIDQWHHLAVTRDVSDVCRVFVDGIQVASGTDATTTGVDQGAGVSEINLGRGGGTDNGDMDMQWEELLVSNTIARYTEAFVPPTAPFRVL